MLYKFFKLDWVLISSVLLLLGVGLLTLYSISTVQDSGLNIFQRQLVFAIGGIFLMFFISFIDYQYFASYTRAIYIITIILMIAVLVFGSSIRGTVGWIDFGFFRLQPVELAKIFLIISLASFFSRKKGELGDLAKIISSAVVAGIIIGLVMMQPDFGSSVILMGIWGTMLLFSGIDKKYVFSLLIIGLISVAVGWFLLAPYQKERVVNLFNPERDPMGTGYNVIQSIVAVGSGGAIGKGIGQGTQSQLNFLPEKHTDFIFAVIVEESGFVGAVFVMSLFVVLFYRMKKIAENAYDNFGYLIAIGVMIMFFLQILINVGMNLGIMPVTGITLPILSYGGSSLVSIFISLGILLNISDKGKERSDFEVIQSH
ncbi:rod shape-determining protein RodA [Patescibacteria group bacterium]